MDLNDMNMDDIRERMLPQAVRAMDDYDCGQLSYMELLNIGGSVAERCQLSSAVIFLRLLQDFPTDPDILLAAGSGLYNIDDFSCACNVFSDLCDLQPDNALAHTLHGLCLLQTGYEAEAKKEIKKAVQLDGSAAGCFNVSVFYAKACEIYTDKSRERDAAKAHEKARLYAEKAAQDAIEDADFEKYKNWLIKVLEGRPEGPEPGSTLSFAC